MKMLRAVGPLLLLSLTVPVRAAETARQILDRAKQLDDTTRHWDDRHQTMKLTIAGHGPERVRELELYERRYGDEHKSMAFFLGPAEVKGTAFLAYTHKGRPADQWLYTPELQRVRQITARTRDESFVGSDFSYHDLDLIAEMARWTENDARSSLRGEETVDAVPCHVIELTPQREDIGYKRIVTWLGKGDLVARRLEFFATDATPTKRLEQYEIRDEGAIPVAHRIEVVTPAKGTRTTVLISGVQHNQGIDDDLFTQHRLERGVM